MTAIKKLVEQTAEAKLQADTWKDEYDAGRDRLFAAMVEEHVQTATYETSVGEVIATVVGESTSESVNAEKLREKLIAAGIPTARVNRTVRKKLVTVYEVDDDEVAALIEDGLFKARNVPTIKGSVRKAFAKITIRS